MSPVVLGIPRAKTLRPHADADAKGFGDPPTSSLPMDLWPIPWVLHNEDLKNASVSSPDDGCDLM